MVAFVPRELQPSPGLWLAGRLGTASLRSRSKEECSAITSSWLTSANPAPRAGRKPPRRDGPSGGSGLGTCLDEEVHLNSRRIPNVMPARSPPAGSPALKRVPVGHAAWLPLAGGAVLAAGAIAVYCQTFSVPLIFDDRTAIAGNLTIRHWSTALWPPPGTTASGRPMLNLSLAINHAISGTAVWSYHALNLVIHILAGLTLFGIVRRTLVRRTGAAASSHCLLFCASLDPAPAADRIGDLHRPARGVAHGAVLPAHRVLLHPRHCAERADAGGPPAGAPHGFGTLSVLLPACSAWRPKR